MCVKIFKNDIENLYDHNMPLEDQIVGSDKIVINYEPFDSTLDKFIKEIKKLSNTAMGTQLNIKVIHNDHIMGLKLKKHISNANNDIKLNEIIKLMVLNQAETDNKLKELYNYCTDINDNVK